MSQIQIGSGGQILLTPGGAAIAIDPACCCYPPCYSDITLADCPTVCQPSEPFPVLTATFVAPGLSSPTITLTWGVAPGSDPPFFCYLGSLTVPDDWALMLDAVAGQSWEINSYYCDVYYDGLEEFLEWSLTAIWFAADLGEEQALARSQHCWICEPYLVVLPMGGYTIVITENGDESMRLRTEEEQEATRLICASCEFYIATEDGCKKLGCPSSRHDCLASKSPRRGLPAEEVAGKQRMKAEG